MQAIPAATSLPHLQYRWVIAISLLLSAWLMWLDPLVNRDAIIYLRSADAYLQGGLAAAQQVHGRPLLSVCIALLHQLTGMSLLHAGLIITTVAYAALCVSFVATVRLLGGNRTVQIIAAVVVLSHPMLNQHRSSIMRDPAYWALLMLSFRELLLYLRHPSLISRLRWFLYVLLAAAFRFEGVFFAIIAPFALLFARNLEHRLRHCLLLLVPQITTLAVVALSVIIYRSQQTDSSPLFPAINYYLDSLKAFPEQFSAVAQQASEPLLRFTSRDDAPWAVTAGLAVVLLLNICRALSWPWAITLLWGTWAQLHRHFRSHDSAVLRVHLFIATGYLAVFILINRFMLERYSMQAVIFLLLYLPFILGALWQHGGWKKYLVIVLLAGMTADTLHNGNREKAFIQEATHWVVQNTDEGASLVSNEKYIAYFSQREFNWAAIQAIQFSLGGILESPRLWRDQDYLVMYIKPEREKLWKRFLRDNSLEELQSFGEGRRGRVAIVPLTAVTR
ncbi:MAG: hypothetical protein ABJN62_00165 [Halioglobus sp.]